MGVQNFQVDFTIMKVSQTTALDVQLDEIHHLLKSFKKPPDIIVYAPLNVMTYDTEFSYGGWKNQL